MDRTAASWALEPLRKFATLSGRAPRAEYWWFYLFCIAVSTVISVLDRFLPLAIGAVLNIALLVPQVAAAVRRLHDTDRSGLWIVIPLVAAISVLLLYNYYGLAALTGFGSAGQTIVLGALGIGVVGYSIVLLVWFCTKGTDGPNRYGPDPLDSADDVAEVFR